mgnify:FL=1
MGGLLQGTLLPKFQAGNINSGDMNDYVIPICKSLDTYSDPSFIKNNWPEKIRYGVFCVNTYDSIIVQEIFDSRGYAFRTRKNNIWSEWVEILNSEQ